METVYVRWCNELVSKKQYSKASQILLTLGMFYEVVQVLHEWEQYHTCMMFYRALVEKNLWCEGNVNSRLRSVPHISPELLKESIHTDYGIYMMEIAAQETVQGKSLVDYIRRLDFESCFQKLDQLKQ